MIEVICRRRINLPPQPVVQCEIGGCFPGILGIGIEALGASINKAAAALSITIWNSQQEIRAGVARGKQTCAVVREAAVVPVGERITYPITAAIESELQGVSTNH